MPALKYWLWLSSAEVSAKAKAAVAYHYGSAEAAFHAPEGEFSAINGVNPTEAALLERRDLRGVSHIMEECALQNLDIITIQDAAYPKRLRNIFSPPVVLYVKGRLPEVDDNPLISVIGTRSASPYGLKMCRDITWQICRCGGTVVSGLTHGIDREAAVTALRAGGKCVAVLGTPHETETGSVAADVAAHGAVVSEYPPGTAQQRHFFRERNRVAAGLSVGVVVVEAPEKSGARLFVAEALDQGKEIFAVPGNADAENSAGTIALLKEGAQPVTCGADVMAEFEALYPEKIHLSRELPPMGAVLREQAPPERRRKPPEAPKKPAAQKSVDKGPGRDYIDLKEQLAALSETQLKIVTAIDRQATHIDDIIEATGLPTATVLAQLTVLEIKGYVRREPGRRIVLNTAKK